MDTCVAKQNPELQNKAETKNKKIKRDASLLDYDTNNLKSYMLL